MQEIIDAAKAEFLRAKERITHNLATTPDDRINWSPTPTARTPVQQVAHAAMATTGIQGLLMGKPFPYASLADLDPALRLAEKEFTTREQALSLLEQTSAEYLQWLDTMTPEQMASTVHLPSRPSFPMAVGITLPADHMRSHCAQIDYIQTIYGDRDWHM